MEGRINVSQDKIREGVMKARKRVEKKFLKESASYGIDVMELDSITVGKETFYNPFIYKNFNRWAILTN